MQKFLKTASLQLALSNLNRLNAMPPIPKKNSVLNQIAPKADQQEISANSQALGSPSTLNNKAWQLQQVRQITAKHTRTTFQILEEPSQNGQRMCQDHQAIKKSCMNKGIRSFTQSSETPFLQEPLLSNNIGPLATEAGVEQSIPRLPDSPLL